MSAKLIGCKTKSLRLEQAALGEGPLVLVNRRHPIQCAPARLAQTAQPGVLLQEAAAAALGLLLRRTGAGGGVLPVSGYRTLAEQQAIYTDTRAGRGPAYAATYVALPGCSEHQTGLAVDMALGEGPIDPVAPAFPDEGLCRAFRLAAPWAGFVLRYPQGRHHLTGIGYEPWHFRYVGLPHSLLMEQRGLVLEEYIEMLRAHPLNEAPLAFEAGGRRGQVGFVPWGPGGAALEAPGGRFALSGNNADGFIVTVWEA